jgi:hypothetical protein
LRLAVVRSWGLRIALTNPKYEILFDAASFALKDSYSREAIATYSSALERFYEFFIRVVLLHPAGLGAVSLLSASDPVANHAAGFDQTWTCARKQSERQFGMFLIAHQLLAVQKCHLPTWLPRSNGLA